MSECLTIDHIFEDGKAHREELGTRHTIALYQWLINNDFPDTFQVLCMNCNFAKYLNGGLCPHQESVTQLIERYA